MRNTNLDLVVKLVMPAEIQKVPSNDAKNVPNLPADPSLDFRVGWASPSEGQMNIHVSLAADEEGGQTARPLSLEN
ncbi:unnamed protein product, partial [Mycena citricolor]